MEAGGYLGRAQVSGQWTPDWEVALVGCSGAGAIRPLQQTENCFCLGVPIREKGRKTMRSFRHDPSLESGLGLVLPCHFRPLVGASVFHSVQWEFYPFLAYSWGEKSSGTWQPITVL